MKIVEIKCDHCKADLTDAGAMPSYRLELAPQSIPNSGSILYDVLVRPPIDRAHHFCGIHCLVGWLHAYHPKALAVGQAGTACDKEG